MNRIINTSVRVNSVQTLGNKNEQSKHAQESLSTLIGAWWEVRWQSSRDALDKHPPRRTGTRGR